jgi:hypothetical protein
MRAENPRRRSASAALCRRRGVRSSEDGVRESGELSGFSLRALEYGRNVSAPGGPHAAGRAPAPPRILVLRSVSRVQMDNPSGTRTSGSTMARHDPNYSPISPVSVHVPPVPHAHDGDEQPVIQNLIDDPIDARRMRHRFSAPESFTHPGGRGLSASD